jgi:hypothetical protein
MNDFLIKEIYQLLFIVSAIYFGCVALLFLFRFVRNVRYNINTTMTFGLVDKILLLLTTSVILTYLI